MDWSFIFVKVLTIFFHSAIVAALYCFSKIYIVEKRKNQTLIATKGEKKLTYVSCLLYMAVGSFIISALTYGDSEDIDKAYQDTIIIFLILFPSSALGVYFGFEKDTKLKREKKI